MADDPKILGYHTLPGSFQSRRPRKKADLSTWISCHGCGKAVPSYARSGWSAGEDETDEGALTYRCPHCGHVEAHGPVPTHIDGRPQSVCHECEAPLEPGALQCRRCAFPVGWMTVTCPYCGNRQATYCPHWCDGCDGFTLECVACESLFESLCIC